MATMMRDDTMAYPKPPRQQDGKGRPTKPRGKLISVEPAEPQWPCNPQAERALMHAVLAAPETFGDYADIAASDFYLPNNQTVWQAMLDVYEAGEHQPNLEAVTDRLYQVHGLQEVGGQGFLTDITAGSISNTFNAPTFAAIVRRTAAQRKLMKRGADLVAQAAARDADPDEVLARFATDAEAIVAANATKRDEHVHELRDLMAMQLPDTRWVVPGLIPEGALLLASKPKIGKSWLALSLVLSVAAGGYALGSKEHRCDMGSALYLALEDTPKRIQRRVRMLLGPDEYIPELATIATKWPRLDKGGLVKIERWLKGKRDGGYEPRLVVIDVLGKVKPPRAKGGDMYAEDYAVMSSLKELADEYHVAVLLVHHTRKAVAEDVFDEVRDTVASGADVTMVLQRERGKADATLHITGRDVDEGALALAMDKQSCNWKLLGDAGEVARSSERGRILDFLAEQPNRQARLGEIVKGLGLKYENVKMLLSRMYSDGEVLRNDNGVYERLP